MSHPEPQQAGLTNSHSAVFPHDPRQRLEAHTESRDTSRHNRAFMAHVNQPKLAPQLIAVNIPSPALSPLSLPAPVLPITHNFPVPPTHDAVPPYHEFLAAPARRLAPSPQTGSAP